MIPWRGNASNNPSEDSRCLKLPTRYSWKPSEESTLQTMVPSMAGTCGRSQPSVANSPTGTKDDRGDIDSKIRRCFASALSSSSRSLEVYWFFLTVLHKHDQKVRCTIKSCADLQYNHIKTGKSWRHTVDYVQLVSLYTKTKCSRNMPASRGVRG